MGDATPALLAELDRLLLRGLRGGSEALAESALRALCSQAAQSAYPAASDAEHEMDVRRLLNLLVDAYAGSHEPPAQAGSGNVQGEPVFVVSTLRAAVRQLQGAPH